MLRSIGLIIKEITFKHTMLACTTALTVETLLRALLSDYRRKAKDLKVIWCKTWTSFAKLLCVKHFYVISIIH